MEDTNQFLPGSNSTFQDRRHDHDVTDSVDVTSVDAVRIAVMELLKDTYPGEAFDNVWVAFHDFERLFNGQMAGYLGCDTVYHDKQHSLDVTLALARLIAGFEQSADDDDHLGPTRAAMGIVTALFHDSGYILTTDDVEHVNGAEYTLTHVSRSAEFLSTYLLSIGMRESMVVATQIVHFTGYERNVDEIELDNPKDSALGYLLGTADLIAQMADRCYLEKCRDRLYSEFVLAGIAITAEDGLMRVRYQSGTDLLLQTPGFYQNFVQKRLEHTFNHAYRYIEVIFSGQNPYMAFIDKNITYLKHVIATGQWPSLRRNPPCHTTLDNAVIATNLLVNQRITSFRETPLVLGTG